MADIPEEVCVFCKEGEEAGSLRNTSDEDILAHYNCLLFSPEVITRPQKDSQDNTAEFDISSVKSEINRGKKLKCSYCNIKGATVGCYNRWCRKTYHYLCVTKAKGIHIRDEEKELYIAYCDKHARKGQFAKDAQLNNGTETSEMFIPPGCSNKARKNKTPKKRKKKMEHKTARKKLRFDRMPNPGTVRNAEMRHDSDNRTNGDNMEVPGPSRTCLFDIGFYIRSDSGSDVELSESNSFNSAQIGAEQSPGMTMELERMHTLSDHTYHEQMKALEPSTTLQQQQPTIASGSDTETEDELPVFTNTKEGEGTLTKDDTPVMDTSSRLLQDRHTDIKACSDGNNLKFDALKSSLSTRTPGQFASSTTVYDATSVSHLPRHSPGVTNFPSRQFANITNIALVSTVNSHNSDVPGNQTETIHRRQSQSRAHFSAITTGTEMLIGQTSCSSLANNKCTGMSASSPRAKDAFLKNAFLLKELLIKGAPTSREEVPPTFGSKATEVQNAACNFSSLHIKALSQIPRNSPGVTSSPSGQFINIASKVKNPDSLQGTTFNPANVAYDSNWLSSISGEMLTSEDSAVGENNARAQPTNTCNGKDKLVSTSAVYHNPTKPLVDQPLSSSSRNKASDKQQLMKSPNNNISSEQHNKHTKNKDLVLQSLGKTVKKHEEQHFSRHVPSITLGPANTDILSDKEPLSSPSVSKTSNVQPMNPQFTSKESAEQCKQSPGFSKSSGEQSTRNVLTTKALVHTVNFHESDVPVDLTATVLKRQSQSVAHLTAITTGTDLLIGQTSSSSLVNNKCTEMSASSPRAKDAFLKYAFFLKELLIKGAPTSREEVPPTSAGINGGKATEVQNSACNSSPLHIKAFSHLPRHSPGVTSSPSGQFINIASKIKNPDSLQGTTFNPANVAYDSNWLSSISGEMLTSEDLAAGENNARAQPTNTCNGKDKLVSTSAVYHNPTKPLVDQPLSSSSRNKASYKQQLMKSPNNNISSEQHNKHTKNKDPVLQSLGKTVKKHEEQHFSRHAPSITLGPANTDILSDKEPLSSPSISKTSNVQPMNPQFTSKESEEQCKQSTGFSKSSDEQYTWNVLTTKSLVHAVNSHESDVPVDLTASVLKRQSQSVAHLSAITTGTDLLIGQTSCSSLINDKCMEMSASSPRAKEAFPVKESLFKEAPTSREEVLPTPPGIKASEVQNATCHPSPLHIKAFSDQLKRGVFCKTFKNITVQFPSTAKSVVTSLSKLESKVGGAASVQISEHRIVSQQTQKYLSSVDGDLRNSGQTADEPASPDKSPKEECMLVEEITHADDDTVLLYGQTLDKPASPSSHQENGCKLVEEIKHVDEDTALLFGQTADEPASPGKPPEDGPMLVEKITHADEDTVLLYGQTLDKSASLSDLEENGPMLVEEITHMDEDTALLSGQTSDKPASPGDLKENECMSVEEITHTDEDPVIRSGQTADEPASPGKPPEDRPMLVEKITHTDEDIVLLYGQTLDKSASLSDLEENGPMLVEEITHMDEDTALLSGQTSDKPASPGDPKENECMSVEEITHTDEDLVIRSGTVQNAEMCLNSDDEQRRSHQLMHNHTDEENMEVPGPSSTNLDDMSARGHGSEDLIFWENITKIKIFIDDTESEDELPEFNGSQLVNKKGEGTSNKDDTSVTGTPTGELQLQETLPSPARECIRSCCISALACPAVMSQPPSDQDPRFLSTSSISKDSSGSQTPKISHTISLSGFPKRNRKRKRKRNNPETQNFLSNVDENLGTSGGATSEQTSEHRIVSQQTQKNLSSVDGDLRNSGQTVDDSASPGNHPEDGCVHDGEDTVLLSGQTSDKPASPGDLEEYGSMLVEEITHTDEDTVLLYDKTNVAALSAKSSQTETSSGFAANVGKLMNLGIDQKSKLMEKYKEAEKQMSRTDRTKVQVIKKRWKTMRDNYRREHLIQNNIRSGSAGKRKGRVYCHYEELMFLKPVMEMRPTESNMESETEEDPEDAEQTNQLVDAADFSQISETEAETTEATLATNRQKQRKKTKQQMSEDFLDVVKKLFRKQEKDGGELESFARSLVPQMAKVPSEHQCNMRSEILRLIHLYQHQPTQNRDAPYEGNTSHHFYGRYDGPGTLRSQSYPSAAASRFPVMSQNPYLSFQMTQNQPRFQGGPYKVQPYFPNVQAPPPTPLEETHHPSTYQNL
ncbi:uncharacterized protein [Aquarana catesbeiana]|uniref:uncharacterized protein isoform X3 n=1 Tax=Aquarana catesbeiana TaxID=8400 RepID=UPI003CC92A29